MRYLGSLHGTYVNRKLIGQRQAHQTPEEAAKQNFPEYDLKDGDEIKLSNTLFKLGIQGVSSLAETIPIPPPIGEPPNAGDPNLNYLFPRHKNGSACNGAAPRKTT